MIKLVLYLFGLIVVSAHPYYMDAIPKGYAVFNPWGSSYWEALGHYVPDHHTKEKNPFGRRIFLKAFNAVLSGIFVCYMN